jgi:peptide subunit release factor 1 (eRF1)
MITREILRELADFQSSKGDAITFYYQPYTPQDKSHRQEAIQIKDIVKEAMRKAERSGKNGTVRGDLERILEMSDRLHGNAGRAKAIFACASQGFWREYDLPAHLPSTELRINGRFHVSPLAGLDDAMGKACVCVLDRTKARLFEVEDNHVKERESYFAETVRRGRSDGFAGFDGGHAERRADNEALGHYRRVAEHLLERYGAGQCGRIVIGCRDEAWPDVERQLHPYIKQRFAGRFVADAATITPEHVREVAERIVAQHRQERLQELLRETLDEARANNYGALGLKRVLRSLEQGEIQSLLIGNDFHAEGVECTNCGHLDIRMVSACALCGQKTHQVDDIRDLLVGRAIRSDIEVLQVPGAHTEFQKAGNIGALLRYRSERSIGEKLA